MIRVMLADDQALVRSGFRLLLESANDIAVVGEAQDGRQVLALLRTTPTDVVLMDIRMPQLDGIEATRLIAADPALAEVKVVVLTTFEDDEYLFRALRIGASGFLTKDVELPELLQAVRVAAAGEALLSPKVTRRVIARALGHCADPRKDSPALATLTQREREVLALIGRGMSNDDVAAALHLSPLTAKTHAARIMTKLGARDRAQLVVTAYESGLVTPSR